MTLAVQIAERINALRYEDITQAALDWTASAFADTVGVTLWPGLWMKAHRRFCACPAWPPRLVRR